MEKKDEGVNDGLKLLANSAIIVFGAFVVSKIFGYLYRIIIARYFGPEVYGLFSLAIIVVGWFAGISYLGLTEGVSRFIPLFRGKNEKNKVNYVFQISALALFFSTILTATILFLLSEYISLSIFHNESLIIYLKIFSIMIPFWVFGIFFIATIRSFEKIRQASFFDGILQSFAKLSFLVILIYLGFKTNAIIFSFFAGVLVLFFATLFYCKIKIPQIFKKSNLSKKLKIDIAKNLFSYSWPMLFLVIISSLFYWIDSFAIGYFKTATEVGFYNAVVPIAILLNLTPEIFLQLFFPLITRKYSTGDNNFIGEVSKQIGKWIFMINLPILILIIFFSETIISILFGGEYIVASNSLRLLSIAGLFSSVFIISNNLLSMAGKSKILFYDIIIASVLNIILNFFLIPMPSIFGIDNSLGINGAAISTAISLLILNFLFLFQAWKYTRIVPLKKEMMKILFAAIISTGIMFFLRGLIEINYLSFAMLSINFLAIYLICLFVMKAFDENDLMILRTIVDKTRPYFKKDHS
ncbi:MAG: flippase [Nanoarchaeota archaeon]